jgi:hypothetical protein
MDTDISVKYTASILRIEEGKVANVAGYREVGGKEMNVGPQAYLARFWSDSHDLEMDIYPFHDQWDIVSHCIFSCFMTNRTSITHFCSVLPSTGSLRYCLKPSQTSSSQTAVFYWKLFDAVPDYDRSCEDFCIFFDFCLINKQGKDNDRIYCVS